MPGFVAASRPQHFHNHRHPLPQCDRCRELEAHDIHHRFRRGYVMEVIVSILRYSSHFAFVTEDVRARPDFQYFLRRGLSYAEKIMRRAARYIVDRLSLATIYEIQEYPRHGFFNINAWSVITISAGFVAACNALDPHGTRLDWVNSCDNGMCIYAAIIRNGAPIDLKRARIVIGMRRMHDIKVSTDLKARIQVRARELNMDAITLAQKLYKHLQENDLLVHYWDEMARVHTRSTLV